MLEQRKSTYQNRSEVQKYVAPPYQNETTITFKCNGETVEWHEVQMEIESKKRKHFAMSAVAFLLTLAALIVSILFWN